MKVKLLKQVRKRFQIVHYPNGIPLQDDKECMVLYDYDMDWSTTISCEYINKNNTKEDVYAKLYIKLTKRIFDYYQKYGTRRLKKQTAKVLWYKNK